MALFKIFNNIDSKTPIAGEENKYTYNELPNTYKKGYMYFDASKNLFYIDTAGDGGETGTRVALNAYGANKAYADENDDRITTTYVKNSDLIENVLSSIPIGIGLTRINSTTASQGVIKVDLANDIALTDEASDVDESQGDIAIYEVRVDSNGHLAVAIPPIPPATTATFGATLTIGSYTYNGTENVTIPVYDGEYFGSGSFDS